MKSLTCWFDTFTTNLRITLVNEWDINFELGGEDGVYKFQTQTKDYFNKSMGCKILHKVCIVPNRKFARLEVM